VFGADRGRCTASACSGLLDTSRKAAQARNGDNDSAAIGTCRLAFASVMALSEPICRRNAGPECAANLEAEMRMIALELCLTPLADRAPEL
jgi:hypothetical protein